MAVVSNSDNDNNNNEGHVEILKSSVMDSEEIESKSPPLRNSNTRELIKKAREAANHKFAQTIGKNKNIVASTERKIVLKGEEMGSRHGNLIKTKLKRPNNPIKPKFKEIKSTIRANSNSLSINPRPSKCLFEFYKEIRGEYEDFREIEASRLKKRLEKLSDFPEGSDLLKFEGKSLKIDGCV